MSHVPLEIPHSPRFYCSFLIRMWQDHDQAPWRASAQSVQTGVIVRFADLDGLFVFLAKEASPSESEP